MTPLTDAFVAEARHGRRVEDVVTDAGVRRRRCAAPPDLENRLIQREAAKLTGRGHHQYVLVLARGVRSRRRALVCAHIGMF